MDPHPFLPVITDDDRFFWDGCREHALQFQRCDACSHVRWPASFLCPQCSASAYHLAKSGGTGTVYSFTVFRKAFAPQLESCVPYVVAWIDLDVGTRLLTNIIGCDISGVHCGMPVKVAWEQPSEDVSLPVFSPA